jgi:hypothetical protein
MKKYLLITLLFITIGVKSQKPAPDMVLKDSVFFSQNAPDEDTIIDSQRWIVKHYIATHGYKWTELMPVDTSTINNLQYHRDKVFLYFDSLLIIGCCDGVYNSLVDKRNQWLSMDGGKNVLSSYPEHPLSEAEEEKLKAYFNPQR